MMSERTTEKVELVIKEAMEPTAHGDYARFWHLINNRELVEFTMGKDKYEQALLDCFPHMKPDKAKSYTEALISLLK